MKKYFELRENGNVLFGVIENIPEEINIDQIIDRIEFSDDNKSVKLTENIVEQPDIIFDWLTLDDEETYDSDYMSVVKYLSLAITDENENEMVYLALKNMKDDPTISISDAIKTAYSKK